MIPKASQFFASTFCSEVPPCCLNPPAALLSWVFISRVGRGLTRGWVEAEKPIRALPAWLDLDVGLGSAQSADAARSWTVLEVAVPGLPSGVMAGEMFLGPALPSPGEAPMLPALFPASLPPAPPLCVNGPWACGPEPRQGRARAMKP